MATAQLSQEQRIVFDSADWAMYEGFLKALDNRPVRVTYDRGHLEIMTLSFPHEKSSNLLGRLVEVLTEELNIPLQSAGSTTLKREDLDKGVEADQSYYLENEPMIRDKEEIDLTVDPPPDLALEIDITRSSLNRMGIYAALRVPEVWRYDGEKLTVYRLDRKGKYRVVDRSVHFPFLPLSEITRFLNLRSQLGETGVVRAFRKWVQEQQAKGWSGNP